MVIDYAKNKYFLYCMTSLFFMYYLYHVVCVCLLCVYVCGVCVYLFDYYYLKMKCVKH